jgi:hypothetical protein
MWSLTYVVLHLTSIFTTTSRVPMSNISHPPRVHALMVGNYCPNRNLSLFTTDVTISV